MLEELISSGFGEDEDYNCAEKIFYGANIAYGLQMDNRYGHLLASYGGGMGVEHLCGAVAAGVAILGYMFIENIAHEGETIKRLTGEFIERYREEMGDILCKPLKDSYRTDETQCFDVIVKAAEILDDIVLRERNYITKPMSLNNKKTSVFTDVF
ncbi:MAG: C-GCAxxG-C-C family (seleno)protein [Bacillota bacterium]|jgi:C_GCAxxG_C_C family probable redox protein